jgi:hypothetical protein
MYSSNVYHIPILHSSVPLIRRVFLFPILTPTTHVTDYCLPQFDILAVAAIANNNAVTL